MIIWVIDYLYIYMIWNNLKFVMESFIFLLMWVWLKEKYEDFIRILDNYEFYI